MDLYYNDQKVSVLSIEPTSTVGQVKNILNDWLVPQGITNYNVKIIFNDGSELSPSVFQSDKYNNINFQQQALLLSGGSIHVNSVPTTLSSQHSVTKSLYERLGGIYSIAAVVNLFSDQIIENPHVGKNSPNPQLRDWSRNKLDRLPGLKFQRTLWLADVSGGPFKFHSTKHKCPSDSQKGECRLNLTDAHCPFKISPAEFDEVVLELEKALDFYNVPSREKNEVLAAFLAHKKEVNMCFYK